AVAFGDIAQGDQRRAGNAIDLIFVRLADIDNRELVATVEPLLEVDGRDFGGVGCIGHRRWLRGCVDAAELLVIDELCHRRVRAADRAIGILLQLQLAEFHPQRGVDQEPPDERLAYPEDQLHRFGRLDDADDARQHAEDAALGAARHEPWRRWFRIQAAVARTFGGREYRRLSFEPEDTAVRVRLAQDHARV